MKRKIVTIWKEENLERKNISNFENTASSVSLHDVKGIDIKMKYLVNGYVMQIQNLLPDDNVYYTIPTLIIHWILLYFYIPDAFDPDKCHKVFELSKDNTLITHKQGSTNKSAYLSRIVDHGVYCWKFKLHKVYVSGFTMCIGVWKSKYEINTNNKLHISLEGQHYTWVVTRNYLKPRNNHKTIYNERKLVEGDIIDMILDLNKLQLRYRVNGEDFGIAKDNIEQTAYQATVSFYYAGDSILLMDSKWINL